MDADGDLSQYDFDWYVKRDGELTFSSFRDGNLSPSISSQINNSDTLPGDQWYVVVTPHDGEAYGTPASTESTPTQIVLGGVEPSFIALGVAPNAITLGQSVTASGNIFPVPSGSPNVTFTSTSPSGTVSGVFPEGTVAAGGAYTKAFTPTEATVGRNPWSITATWPGDDTYQSATSSAVPIMVNKAQPVLALDVSPDTALVGLVNSPDFAVTATLSVPGLPESLEVLLAGRGVALSVVDGENEPQGEVTVVTNSDGEALFDKSQFVTAGITFDSPGVWRFKAAFASDDNLLSTETADFDDTDARLTIKRGAGYAIVVLGRLDAEAEGHKEHALTADFIYDTLIERQFAADDIHYLREYLDDQGESNTDNKPIFGAATETKLTEALNVVKAKMLHSPAPLYIVLVDHGSPGVFYMDDVATPGVQETLTPAELDFQLDQLQSSFVEANNTEASAQEIVVINGSCYSGSFIPALSGENRVVITSTTADTISYRGIDRTPGTDGDVRDGEFFLMELFRNLGEGATIRTAYEDATETTLAYTAPTNNSVGTAGTAQAALLDDNGDGVGTHGTLSSALALDGGHAKALTLGLGSNAAGGVSWFTATPSLTLGDTKALTEGLFAKYVGRDLAEGDRAWLEVKRPDSVDAVASTEHPDLQREWSLAGPLYPDPPLGDGNGRLDWSAAALNTAVGFDVPGTYKAYYFLYDGQTRQVASYLVTNIYVTKAGNQAPTPVVPLLPANDAVIETSGSVVHFGWQSSADPDGFTYTLEISPDTDFAAETTAIASGLESRYIIYNRDFREAHGLPEATDGTYYWRVYAVDVFGAVSEIDSIRSVTITNIANPELPGAIAGTVIDGASELPIAGALVTLNDSPQVTGEDGEFLYLQLNSGRSYIVSATATGYEDSVPTRVDISAGDILLRTIALQRVGGGGGVDSTRPVISITNNTPTANTVDCGSGDYPDPAATASDNVDPSVEVTRIGSVNTDVPGVYNLVYTARDQAGNEATPKVRVVTVRNNCPIVDPPDTTRPVITIADNTVAANTIDCGSGPYADPGATATDDRAGTVPVTTVGTVSGAIPGIFTLVYTARDPAGNEATPVVRTVTVRSNCNTTPTDTTAPLITITTNTNGVNSIGCGQGSFVDPGATAIDDTDGSVAVVVIGAVNANVPGDYVLLYTAVDEAGNQAIPAQRVVTVRDDCTVDDRIAPIITLNEDTEAGNTVDCSTEAYNDPGAIAEDDRDGQVEVHTIGFVNTSLPDTYSLVYTAHDSANNEASVAVRTVVVLDNCTSEGGLLSGLASALLDDFDSADTDEDDTLSYEEALAMMSTLTPAQFALLDTDNSGGLSSAELRAAVTTGEGEGEGETGGGCPPSQAKVLEGAKRALGDVFLFGVTLLTLSFFRRSHS